jgi:hypothetical protein
MDTGFVPASQMAGRETALEELEGVMLIENRDERMKATGRWIRRWVEHIEAESHFDLQIASVLPNAPMQRAREDEAMADAMVAEAWRGAHAFLLLEDRGVQKVKCDTGGPDYDAYVSKLSLTFLRAKPREAPAGTAGS